MVWYRRTSFILVTALLLSPAAARAALSPGREREARALIAKFTDREFAVRQEAVAHLVLMGNEVLPLLRETLDATRDNEVRLRCRMTIDGIRKAPPPKLVERIIREVARKGPGRDAFRSIDGVYTSYIIERNGRDVVVHLGQEHRPYDKVECTVNTPDGQHIAYKVQHEGRCFIVRDGVAQPPWDNVLPVFLSGDGKHLVYRAWRNTPNGREHFMVVDGVASPPCELVMEPRCSPDMKHIGYAARRDGKVFFVLDGVEGPKHDVLEVSLWGGRGPLRGVTIEDGRAWLVEVAWDAAVAAAGGVLRERRVKSLGNVPPEYPGDDVRMRTDARGGAIIFRITRDGKRWVVHNGRETGPYDGIRGSALSADGDHYVFGATRDGKWFATADGKQGRAYDKVWDFQWSADARRLAYRAKRDDAFFIVIDGREIPYSGERGQSRSRHRSPWRYNRGFSPDGKHYYYADHDDKGVFIVCDGYRGRSYVHITGARFSPDSRHLFFEAVTNDWLRRVVCDGLEGPGHGEITQMRVCRETGCLRYLAHRGKTRLVEVEWPAGRDWMSGLEKRPD